MFFVDCFLLIVFVVVVVFVFVFVFVFVVVFVGVWCCVVEGVVLCCQGGGVDSTQADYTGRSTPTTHNHNTRPTPHPID